jgi:butyrate kinase
MDGKIQERIKNIHKNFTIVDAHFDLLIDVENKRKRGQEKVIEAEYLPEFKEGGVNIIVSSIYIEDHYLPEMALRKALGIPVLTVDPPVTDEFCKLARYSGVAILNRVSSFHALNSKATAKKIAHKIGKKYEEINMIVVHLGGGISVSANEKGKAIDVNNSLDGDGPFSPERAGSLPTRDLVKLCFSGKYTESEILQMLTGNGGLVSYLGTSNCQEVEERINEGDEKAEEVYEAMAYQVSKEIGSAAAVLKGDVEVIALTGSLANSERFVNYIKERVSFIAPIHLYPGENEMEALAEGTFRYLNGEEHARTYELSHYIESKVS